jgi:hypothetical protein
VPVTENESKTLSRSIPGKGIWRNEYESISGVGNNGVTSVKLIKWKNMNLNFAPSNAFG